MSEEQAPIQHSEAWKKRNALKRRIAYCCFILLGILCLIVPGQMIGLIVFSAICLCFFAVLVGEIAKWRRARKLGLAEKIGCIKFRNVAPYLLAVLLIVSIGFVLLQIHHNRNKQYTEETLAVVTGDRHNRKYSFAPIVAFEVDGKTHSGVSSTSYKPARYEVGESVILRYNPDNPSEIMIMSKRNLLSFPTLVICSGIFFPGFFFILSILTKYDRKRLKELERV